MAGRTMSAEEASKRMDAALVDWVSAVRSQTKQDRDFTGQHTY
jgi:hypothetical protein